MTRTVHLQHSNLFATEPPALYIPVQITPFARAQWLEIPAKIDTGADISALPLSVRDLFPHLYPCSLRSIITVIDDENSVGMEYESYFFEVCLPPTQTIETATVFPVEVVFIELKKYMILGRDILNQLVMTINGPAQSFTVEIP